MSPEDIKCFLLWSLVINYAILFTWFGTFVFAHDRVYRMHTRWFRMSVETFDAINYGGVAVYKIGVALFNLVPLIALAILY